MQCLYCDRTLSAVKGNVGNFVLHIRTKHPEMFNNQIHVTNTSHVTKLKSLPKLPGATKAIPLKQASKQPPRKQPYLCPPTTSEVDQIQNPFDTDSSESDSSEENATTTELSETNSIDTAKFCCQMCTVTLSSKEEVMKHRHVHYNGVYSCRYCQFQGSAMAIYGHVRSAHRLDPDTNNPYTIENSDDPYLFHFKKTSSCFDEKASAQTSTLVDPVVQKTAFDEEHDLPTDVTTAMKEPIYPQNDFIADNEPLLISPWYIKQSTLNDCKNIMPFVCRYCIAEFFKTTALVHHLSVVHGISPDETLQFFDRKL